MNIRTFALAGAALVLASAAGSTGASAATTFNFLFDNAGPLGADGTIGSPIVGHGTFVSPTDLAPGTYGLSTLTGFSLSFKFGGETFSTGDVQTPISEVAVDITTFGSGERLVFTEDGSPGDGGPLGGSLDLINSAGNGLTFEPSFFGGHNLYQEADLHREFFGNYLALSGGAVPEPASWAMVLLGFGALGGAMRGRRRIGLAV